MIFNKTLNISTEDVYNCEDLEQLRYWAKHVKEDIMRIKGVMAVVEASGKSGDDKYIRAVGAKSYQEALLTAIENQIREVEIHTECYFNNVLIPYLEVKFTDEELQEIYHNVQAKINAKKRN